MPQIPQSLRQQVEDEGVTAPLFDSSTVPRPYGAVAGSVEAAAGFPNAASAVDTDLWSGATMFQSAAQSRMGGACPQVFVPAVAAQEAWYAYRGAKASPPNEDDSGSWT